MKTDLTGFGTVLSSFAGALLAQATQSPEVTIGMLILAGFGLAGMIVQYLQRRLDADQRRLEADRTIRDLREEAADLRAENKRLKRRFPATPDPDLPGTGATA